MEALGPDFWAPVEAAAFPKAKIRFRNDRAAEEIGLTTLTDEQWIAHFGRFEPLSGAQPNPLALSYHGHQFRVYNPEIGDGRGFLFAQMRDHNGRLMDLGTKGSGQTPYSRFGDGRLTLKGGVREILATEMLEALGVETSRTFSLIETGESLYRNDEPSPTRSAVMVRLSHGHIRIGMFQRLAALDLPDAMKLLTNYSLSNLFNIEGGPVELLGAVVERTAHLAASYMAAGFVHGVLNSDNINITGESFDYGPWRFTPHFDPGFTAAYFDEAGLYSFARQAEAIHWDVVQLARSLTLIADIEPLAEQADRFGQFYAEALVERMLWRLGVVPLGWKQDLALVQSIEAALYAQTVMIDRFFFDWRGGSLRNDTDLYEGEEFAEFQKSVSAYSPVHGALDSSYWTDEPCSMHIEEVEAIWSAIADKDDWGPLNQKVMDIRHMGKALTILQLQTEPLA